MSSETLIIDDRHHENLLSRLGTEWRLVTDQVMGGVSRGTLHQERYAGRNCLRLRGEVSTANNGGFIQMALDLSTEKTFDASVYTGLELIVAGNGENYNLHLRTTKLWLPWQSYRAGFKTTATWQTLFVPFTAFEAYRTTRPLDLNQLKRIGLVAIGKDMISDLCLAGIRFKR
ncbi:MAG: CIA30 family protein [Desulfuromonadales bacterium]|nr:CIA30 family protein [Desulfuromonadales bacterium]MBN2793353.1 CIA30 family protein [Desulfuromonadales bacterium]